MANPFFQPAKREIMVPVCINVPTIDHVLILAHVTRGAHLCALVVQNQNKKTFLDHKPNPRLPSICKNKVPRGNIVLWDTKYHPYHPPTHCFHGTTSCICYYHKTYLKYSRHSLCTTLYIYGSNRDQNIPHQWIITPHTITHNVITTNTFWLRI